MKESDCLSMSVSRAVGFESPPLDSEVGTDTNTDKELNQ